MDRATTTAVEFPTPTRVHIAIAVRDVEASLPFYDTLFGQPPTKLRAGYAKYEVLDPPVNFSLNQHADARSAAVGPQHFGIQVKSTDAVRAAQLRLEQAGHATETEEQVTCCYAVQDKIWAIDPDGHRWEVFVVTDADAPVHSANRRAAQAASERACCDPGCCR
jgi:catechol 2,3-dioxygenase-like lactoylglutathione lyase family enzyme